MAINCALEYIRVFFLFDILVAYRATKVRRGSYIQLGFSEIGLHILSSAACLILCKTAYVGAKLDGN